MTGKLSRLRESSRSGAGNDGKQSAATQDAALTRQWSLEHLRGLRQSLEERKRYAERIARIVTWWLIGIALLVLSQGLLGPHGWFGLADSVLIAVATTTTASVTALLIVVLRHLFPKDGQLASAAPEHASMAFV